MKVLLIQLPVPNNALSNLPLALGYLKTSAEAARLPGLMVELLERLTQDGGGDAYLLDAILAHDPDLVGFSLYTWNSTRALALARAIKIVAPEILILGGGPEVNPDNKFIMSEAALDFLVLGEGERTFVELCRHFIQKQPPLRGIAGLGFRSQHEWVINPARVAIEDVNLVPSAYLSGGLENYLGRFMSIELSRWCPSRCTFCYYGRQDLPRGGKRYFDLNRVRAEIEFGLAHGVEQFHFVEANFNTLPHLDQIFETIHQTGANRRAHFYAEMRGEAIDQTEAARLQSAGFDTVEVGLQSAVPEILARVKRKNNLLRLVRGVHLLRERGIEVFLDAILGLPGETPATFNQTLDFIEQHELAPYDLFHLQILAGTQLKAEAREGQHGLIWQDEPPYFVLQTEQLSFEDLCYLRNKALTRKGDDPGAIAGMPTPDVFALTSPKIDELQSAPDLAAPIQRITIDLDAPPIDFASLARRLASEVTLVLQLGEITEAKLMAAQAILTTLSQPNPSGVWHLFVGSQRVLEEAEGERLLKAVQHQVGYLDRLAVFGFQERDPARFKQWPSLCLYNVVPVVALANQNFESKIATLIARLVLDNADTVEQWQTAIKYVLKQTRADLLLEFGSVCELAKIQMALAEMDTNEREIWWGDWQVAAGLALETNPNTALAYPVSYDTAKGRTYQLATSKLDKAALTWTLKQRRLRG